MVSCVVPLFNLSSYNNIFLAILNSILYAILFSLLLLLSDFNPQKTYRLYAQYLNSYCLLVTDNCSRLNICAQLIPKVAWMSQSIAHVMYSHVMYAKK